MQQNKLVRNIKILWTINPYAAKMFLKKNYITLIRKARSVFITFGYKPQSKSMQLNQQNVGLLNINITKCEPACNVDNVHVI